MILSSIKICITDTVAALDYISLLHVPNACPCPVEMIVELVVKTADGPVKVSFRPSANQQQVLQWALVYFSTTASPFRHAVKMCCTSSIFIHQ